MDEILAPIMKGYQEFIAPFVTFGAIGLWLSIHIIMQFVKTLSKKYVNGVISKILDASKYAAPYILGVGGAVFLPIFVMADGDTRPMHEVMFAGFICGFIADKFHLIKKKSFAYVSGKSNISDERKELFSKIERIIT